MSASVHRVLKSKTKDDQRVVDEILQVVADQGRKLSLSNADYQFTKHIGRHSNTRSRENQDCYFDDASSCTTLSDLSTCTRPSTQESNYTSFSEDSGRDALQRRYAENDGQNGIRKSALPPLNPHKIKRPSRPAPRSPIDEFIDEKEVKRPVRPQSARGQRTISSRHRAVSIN